MWKEIGRYTYISTEQTTSDMLALHLNKNQNIDGIAVEVMRITVGSTTPSKNMDGTILAM